LHIQAERSPVPFLELSARKIALRESGQGSTAVHAGNGLKPDVNLCASEHTFGLQSPLKPLRFQNSDNCPVCGKRKEIQLEGPPTNLAHSNRQVML
jgi:hypothetical protein